MELELKNIQNYPLQGNNLKVVDPNGYTASIVGIITTDPFVQVDFDTAQDDVIIRVMYEDGDHKPDYDFATWGISQIKPLLLHMSSLYTEITHNGKTFIPQKELDWGSWNDEIGYIVSAEYGENPRVAINVLDFIDDYYKLLEWHFDVFGLIDKGLALDKTKIK